MDIKDINQGSLNSICASDSTVIAEFSTNDCRPCDLQERLVDGAVHDLRGAAEVVKVDVATDPALAERFNVKSVPTVIVVKDGKVTTRFSGLIDWGASAAAAADA